MRTALSIIGHSVRLHWWRVVGVAVAFTVLYYAALLLFTMARFGEIPNYVEFYDVFHVYGLILEGTPSLRDALPIFMAEPWFETGYKNPVYYGVATWSYMLIPPKMLLVALMGVLIGVFAAMTRQRRCSLKNEKGLVAGASVGAGLVSLTSATLTWVVCCATPSWSVALAMLGMSASLALFLEPLGKLLTVAGLAIMVIIIFAQARALARESDDRWVARGRMS